MPKRPSAQNKVNKQLSIYYLLIKLNLKLLFIVLTAINWLEAKLLIGGTPKLKAFVITYKRLFKTSKELFDEKLSFNSDRKVYFCNLNLYNKCHVICAAK